MQNGIIEIYDNKEHAENSFIVPSAQTSKWPFFILLHGVYYW